MAPKSAFVEEADLHNQHRTNTRSHHHRRCPHCLALVLATIAIPITIPRHHQHNFFLSFKAKACWKNYFVTAHPSDACTPASWGRHKVARASWLRMALVIMSWLWAVGRIWSVSEHFRIGE